MKHIALLGLWAALLFACTTDVLNEDKPSGYIDDIAPETLTVGFEDNVETRIQLQEGKTVWNEGDLVSVFYLSNANQKWQFQGETGDRVGNLKRVENTSATRELSKVVVVYPYDSEYYINPESCNVKAFLPQSQTYLKDSYGAGGNIMISSSEYNQFSLRNVCGWLKVQLTGNADKIKSVRLYGNSGEQVAGEIYINSQDATATLASEMGAADDEENTAGGNLVFDDTILTEVVLDCGDGVTLGEEPVSFYIALPPQTFSEGLTVEITDSRNLKMVKSTANEITISRNVIQPMKAFAFEPIIPESWKIHYKATHSVEPYDKSVFGVNFVSSEWDKQTGEGVMVFDGEVKYIGPDAFNGFAGYSVNGLTGITIPEGADYVYENAFYGCTTLKEFSGKFATDDGKGLVVGDVFMAYAVGSESSDYVIPDGVKAVGWGAFYLATNLKSVTIPSSVKVIEGHAFQKTGLTSVIIPEGTKSIGQYAFDYCNDLNSVTLSSTVGIIHHCAFYGCHSLQSITIPSAVSYIGGDAFYCQSLTDVYLQSVLPPNIENSSLFYNYDGSGVNVYVYSEALDAYKNKWSRYNNIIKSNGNSPVQTITTTITYTTSDGQIITPNNGWTVKSNEYSGGAGKMVIQGYITSIPPYSFRSNTKLTSMTLPESMAVIDDNAFDSCSKLVSINLPYGVTKIGSSAFAYCSKLSEISLSRGLQNIEEAAFSSCSSLSSVVIPSTVENIYNWAFQWVNATVYFMSPEPPTVPSMNGEPAKVFGSAKMYVPAGSAQNYSSYPGWSMYGAVSEYDPSYFLL